jgi:hypothetical protein
MPRRVGARRLGETYIDHRLLTGMVRERAYLRSPSSIQVNGPRLTWASLP